MWWFAGPAVLRPAPNEIVTLTGAWSSSFAFNAGPEKKRLRIAIPRTKDLNQLMADLLSFPTVGYETPEGAGSPRLLSEHVKKLEGARSADQRVMHNHRHQHTRAIRRRLRTWIVESLRTAKGPAKERKSAR